MCLKGDGVLLKVPIVPEGGPAGRLNWVYMPIDRCLSDIIQAFNDRGIYTQSCCCGHGERAGIIFLQDGRVLMLGLNDREKDEVVWNLLPGAVQTREEGEVHSPSS